jgi:hypothetical protein
MSIREQANYPDIVIAPYLDDRTKAYYPLAVYTSGMFSVCSRDKILTYEIDVYASIEAFEAGGHRIDTPIRRTVTEPASTFFNQHGIPVTIGYDDVIMGNAQVVGGVLQILAGLETQFNEEPPVEEELPEEPPE